jgi:hypothetical protein
VSRKRRIAFALLGTIALLLVGGVAWLYFAVRHVPRFYEEAGKLPQAAKKKGSDEMVRRSAALASDANRRGRWQQIFTAEQINGWLAVDLIENYPKLLPPELRDPRVAIHAGQQVIIGCRFEGKISTIVSLEADVSLQAPSVIAVHIRRARAGAVPLPLDKFIPEARHALENAGCLVDLRQSGADPVLLITLPLRTDAGRTLVLTTLVVRDGEIDVAGETK